MVGYLNMFQYVGKKAKSSHVHGSLPNDDARVGVVHAPITVVHTYVAHDSVESVVVGP